MNNKSSGYIKDDLLALVIAGYLCVVFKRCIEQIKVSSVAITLKSLKKYLSGDVSIFFLGRELNNPEQIIIKRYLYHARTASEENILIVRSRI